MTRSVVSFAYVAEFLSVSDGFIYLEVSHATVAWNMQVLHCTPKIMAF